MAIFSGARKHHAFLRLVPRNSDLGEGLGDASEGLEHAEAWVPARIGPELEKPGLKKGRKPNGPPLPEKPLREEGKEESVGGNPYRWYVSD